MPPPAKSKNEDAEKEKTEDNIPDTASQCSTQSQKERFMQKKLKELDEFDLNKKLKTVL